MTESLKKWGERVEDINLNADEYLDQRARRGNRVAFERAMLKVPDTDENLASSIREDRALNENEPSDSDQTNEMRQS